MQSTTIGGALFLPNVQPLDAANFILLDARVASKCPASQAVPENECFEAAGLLIANASNVPLAQGKLVRLTFITRPTPTPATSISPFRAVVFCLNIILLKQT